MEKPHKQLDAWKLSMDLGSTSPDAYPLPFTRYLVN